jgi:hypothetical protein
LRQANKALELVEESFIAGAKVLPLSKDSTRNALTRFVPVVSLMNEIDTFPVGSTLIHGWNCHVFEPRSPMVKEGTQVTPPSSEYVRLIFTVLTPSPE